MCGTYRRRPIHGKEELHVNLQEVDFEDCDQRQLREGKCRILDHFVYLFTGVANYFHWPSSVAAVIMHIVYGIQVQDENDKYIAIAKTAMETVSKAGTPGAFLVDVFPVCTYALQDTSTF